MNLRSLSGSRRESSQAEQDLLVTGRFLTRSLTVALGVVGYAAYAGPQNLGIVLLWCLACGVSGFMVGFLFGFPRVVPDEPRSATGGHLVERPEGRQEGTVRREAYAHRLAINTNLEQVSDWLTKIIVGVGLVELRSLPGHVIRVSAYVSAGFGGAVDVMPFNERLATVILVFFGGHGVLGGYLLTRMFFSAAFRRADLHTFGISDAAMTAIATTPLEDEGRKVGLPASTLEDARKLAGASQEAIVQSPESLAAWARAKFANGEYADAIKGYRQALSLAPADPRLRGAYATALKYGGRPSTEYMAEFERALGIARVSGDPGARQVVYTMYTFHALYLDPPDGYQRALAAAQEYLDDPKNPQSGDVLFNLACAYGQKYKDTLRGADDSEKAAGEVRSRALQALSKALQINPGLRTRAQEMLSGHDPNDDDLAVFGAIPEFRQVAGLP